MRKYRVISKWLCLFAVVPFLLFMAACSDCTSCTVAQPTASIPLCGAAGVAVNSTVTATFSEAMEPSSINGTSFFVTGPGTTAVPGSVAYNVANNVATFTPASNLAFNTTFNITITSAAKSSLGVSAIGGTCSFTTATAPPTVTSLAPTCGSTGVPINQKVAVTFSEAMSSITITAANLYLTGPGTTPIPGAVVYAAASNTATITPTPAGTTLPPGTLITVWVTTGVKDLQGGAMASAFSCSFTTSTGSDTTPPTVISTTPACSAPDVATNTTVSAVFSKPMDPSTITSSTFTLAPTASLTTDVPGSVAYAGSGNTATFTPTNPLAASTSYTLTAIAAIPGPPAVAGVEDLAGNTLAQNFTCGFTTGSGPVTTPPTVILTNPGNLATGVALNAAVNVTFSEAMDPSTITTANILLAQTVSGAAVTGLVSYDALDDIATFTPTVNLLPNTYYTCTITTAVKNVAENPMAAEDVFSFQTGSSGTLGTASVNLNSAAGFAVLAGAGVTNTGPTTVNGNLGVSPGSAVTGFPPGVVNGTQYIDDSIAAQAKLDLTTAYLDAEGRSLNVVIISTGELGGLTLAPGLYQSGISSFAITTEDLTLDAQGDANAVFIFQMPSSTLTVLSGRKVILAGGANAANIFWEVGSSATLGTTSVMEGTIMAYASITLDTGAVLNGRALTQIGSVTLDANPVTLPATAP